MREREGGGEREERENEREREREREKKKKKKRDPLYLSPITNKRRVLSPLTVASQAALRLHCSHDLNQVTHFQLTIINYAVIGLPSDK